MVPSGIDKEKFLIQVERLEQNYALLLDVKTQLGDTSSDAIPLMASERLLQIVIEECLNIGNHIISGLNLERADTYKDIFVRLQQKRGYLERDRQRTYFLRFVQKQARASLLASGAR